ncbi:MAG TPA: response regulator [Bacteroidota bacterium]|nr:response regulator [Bacteroidota bacterium]
MSTPIVTCATFSVARRNKPTYFREMPDRRYRIVIFDDNELLGITLWREFHATGYEAYYLRSKVNGLDWIKQYHPDLIISDIESPELDGFEFLRILKSDPAASQIPFIFLTSRASLESAIEAKNMGAADFVSKPYDPTDLQEVVRRVLQEHSGHDLHASTSGKMPMY